MNWKLLALSAVTVIGLTACGSGARDVGVVRGLPEDSDVVVYFDGREASGQKEELMQFVENFPRFGMDELIKWQIQAEMGGAGDPTVLIDNWLKNFSELFGDDFEIAFGVVTDGLTKTDLETFVLNGITPDLADKVEAYAIMDFSAPALMETILSSAMAAEKSDGRRIWNFGEVVVAREKAEFVFVSDLALVDDVFERLDDGGGFEDRDDVLDKIDQLAAERVAFAYLSSDVGGLFGFEDEPLYEGDAYEVFYFENGVAKLGEIMEKPSEDLLAKKREKDDRNAGKFVDKEGTVMYVESFGLLGAVLPFMVGVDSTLGGDISKESLKEELAANFGLEVAELEALFENPVAFKIGVFEDFYPTMELYLTLSDEEEVQLANRFLEFVNENMDAFIEGFETEVALNGGPSDLLEKEEALIADGRFYKVSMNLERLPADILVAANQFLPEGDLERMKVAFYYGVTGDDVLVLAFDGGFEDDYGKGDNFGDVLGDDLQYGLMAGKPLGDMFGYWYDVAMEAGLDDAGGGAFYGAVRDSFYALEKVEFKVFEEGGNFVQDISFLIK